MKTSKFIDKPIPIIVVIGLISAIISGNKFELAAPFAGAMGFIVGLIVVQKNPLIGFRDGKITFPFMMAMICGVSAIIWKFLFILIK